MAPLQLLVTGVTGFVGGTTLTTLLEREDVKNGNIEITCLVRGEERAKILREQLGVKTAVADLDQVDLVEQAASRVDIVIHTANADHPTGARALASGLEKRFKETGRLPLFIHSSGTCALCDDAKNEYAAEKIFEDFDCADIRAIPDTWIHRSTDIEVTKADERGVLRGYTVMPPLIYSRGTGPFSRTSVQIPCMIRGSLKLGQAPYIGKGLSMWNGVHVQDLVDLYMILLNDYLTGNPQAPHGLEGYYFCATDTYQWKGLAADMGKKLHARGAIPNPEPKSVTGDEEVAIFGTWSSFAYASNSRSKAGKAYTLGWKPKHHTTGLIDSIDAEYDAVLVEGLERTPVVHFDEQYGLSVKRLEGTQA